MKKSDIILGIFLMVLTAGGLWGICLGIKAQEQAGDIPAGDTLPAPVLSQNSGFYDEPFSLHITYSDVSIIPMFHKELTTVA